MVGFAVLLTIYYGATLFATTKALKVVGKVAGVAFYAFFTIFYFLMMYFLIFNHP